MSVASGTHGRAAAQEVWRAVGPLAVDFCVLTKVDVPDDLGPATPERVARCLLAA